AHRAAEDDSFRHVQGVEQVDDAARVVVDGARSSRAAAEPGKMRSDRAPAAIRDRGQLRVPHLRVERKRVEKHDGTPALDAGPGHPFEIVERRYWHAFIVNVPPPRVESDRPTVTVTMDTVCAYRSMSVEPLRPSSVVLLVIGPCVASAFSFATLTFSVTELLVRSKAPESASPITV